MNTTASIASESKRKARLSRYEQLGIPNNTPESIREAIINSGLSYDAYVRTITSTALSDLSTWTQCDLERLLVAAKTHGLNVLNREIFMISNSPEHPPLVAVGVDGWAKIMNSHPQFAGMMFNESTDQSEGIPLWIECEIHRHDRIVPLRVREYFEESRNEHMSWLTHPRRMLRHKCMVQCARLAFGLSGMYDADEALRIKEAKSSAKPSWAKTRQDKPKGIAALAQSLEVMNQASG